MEVAAFLGGLATGTVVGWFGHILTKRRTRDDRRIAHQIEALTKSLEVFNARVNFVIAVNLKVPGWRDLRQKYLELYRVYPYADPTHLADPDALAAYFEIAETPQSDPRNAGWAKEVDKHRHAVIKSLERKRADLLK